ncbi:MAG: hypothetical protein AAF909_10790 [Pseudomonadota bacterium]
MAHWQIPSLRNDEAYCGRYDFECCIPDGPDHWDGDPMRRSVAADMLCVVGGAGSLIEVLKLRSADLKDASTAAETYVRENNWDDLLFELRKTESNESVCKLGPGTIDDYMGWLFSTKERDIYTSRGEYTNGLAKRLRISLLLIAAIRCAVDKALESRVNQLVLADFLSVPSDSLSADDVFSILYIEPLCFCVTPRPRFADISAIVDTASLQGVFEEETLQDPRILYRILMGAPCSFKIAGSAARICDQFYKNGVRTRAATVRPSQFAARKKVLREKYEPGESSFRCPESAEEIYEDLTVYSKLPTEDGGEAAETGTG